MRGDTAVMSPKVNELTDGYFLGSREGRPRLGWGSQGCKKLGTGLSQHWFRAKKITSSALAIKGLSTRPSDPSNRKGSEPLCRIDMKVNR